jgi:hypothetical protein
MQTQQTITLFGTVSNSASSRITKNGRKYTAFGVAIISDRNLQAFSYNVVAWGKEGHFAKSLRATGSSGRTGHDGRLAMGEEGAGSVLSSVLRTFDGPQHDLLGGLLPKECVGK